jgi:sugar O-acyltransferase (sialic acid O-acetyltransferase NeuD family)
MKKTQKLILIGGGGHCRSVIDVAESAGFQIIGILDIPEKVGTSVLGYKIIGIDDQIADYVEIARFVVTVGQIKEATLRVRLHELIRASGGKLATIISPKAYVSRFATIGEGVVIMHQAVVNANASIGKGCIINTFADIEHDAIIGDYCHISTGATVNGGCIVRDKVFIGSNTVIVNGVSITSRCIIGAESLVQKNITESGIYYGIPATLKKVPY